MRRVLIAIGLTDGLGTDGLGTVSILSTGGRGTSTY